MLIWKIFLIQFSSVRVQQILIKGLPNTAASPLFFDAIYVSTQ